MIRFKIILIGALALGWSLAPGADAALKPNVLFIAIDDMNDGITLFGEDRPFKTPNIDKLAERGVFFSRAYCSSAACNPSRASILTGKRPHETGIYGNKADWRNACRNVVTIPEYFRKHGYHVESYGKIYHHQLDGAFNDPDSWDRFRKMDPQFMPPSKLNNAKWYGSANTDWGPWPSDEQESMTIDYKSVGYGSNFLQALVPDKRGLIDDAQAKAVAEFGAEVRRRFGQPIAQTDSGKGWFEPGILELDLGGTNTITHVVLEEEIANGQHVLKYAIDVSAGGAWKTVAERQSIGRKRIERRFFVLIGSL